MDFKNYYFVYTVFEFFSLHPVNVFFFFFFFFNIRSRFNISKHATDLLPAVPRFCNSSVLCQARSSWHLFFSMNHSSEGKKPVLLIFLMQHDAFILLSRHVQSISFQALLGFVSLSLRLSKKSPQQLCFLEIEFRALANFNISIFMSNAPWQFLIRSEDFHFLYNNMIHPMKQNGKIKIKETK